MIVYSLVKGVNNWSFSSKMVKQGCYFVFCAFLAFSFTNCKEDTGELNVPGNLGDNYTLAFNDSITIKKSTVLLDSLPTSSTGTLLVGSYTDSKFGEVKSTPYFQVTLGNDWALSEEAIFDSLVLILNYTGYYYGDTTIAQNIEVRIIKEEIKPVQLAKFWYDMGLYSYFDNNYFGNELRQYIYNNTQFAVEPALLGSKTFIPHPRRKGDSLAVRLDDALGMDFFQKKKEFSPIMKPSEQTITNKLSFSEYFRGLAISCAGGSSIFGLNATTGVIRLHYHQDDGARIVKMVHNFTVNSNNHYNHIKEDRSGTLIAGLTKGVELPSEATNDETYVQSGVGIVTKLYFPGLFNIGTLPGFKQITKAQLIIEPIKNSYTDNYYLPDELILFTSNRTNLPVRPLTSDFSNTVQVSKISIDPEQIKSPSYTFNLTQYIQSISNSRVDPRDIVLLISTSPNASSGSAAASSDLRNNIFKTTTRAVLNANYKTRFEIYYLKRKTQD